MWQINILSILATAQALNVLVFLPGAHRYERRGLERIAQYLALKHHGVATFKAILIPEEKQLIMPKLHLVEELALRDLVPLSTSQELKELGNNPGFWDCGKKQPRTKPLTLNEPETCSQVLNSDLLDRIRSLRIELAVIKPGQNCYLGIVHKLRIPFVYFDTKGFSEDIAIASGTRLQLSEIPTTQSSAELLLDGNSMTMVEKATGLGHALKAYLPYLTWFSRFSTWWFRSSPADDEDAIMQAFLQLENHSDIIRPSEVKRKAALFFVNSDPLLEPGARAVPPNLIYVGGAHMEYPRPLFTPWNETIALGPDGVIVVSFGEFVNASTMPEQMTQAFLHVFRSLASYRVFWRIKSNLPTGIKHSDVPQNVNFTQFLPQADLLGDRNTKLLITHGGMDSVMEALHLGVPVLGIPLFGSNYNTLRKMQGLGVASVLDKCQITKETLGKTIREMLKNRYRVKSKQLSAVIKNRPIDGFESAIHWIETVARNPWLFRKEPMPIGRQFFLDVVSTEIGFVVATAILFLVLWVPLRFLTRKTRTKEVSETSDYERKVDMTKTQDQ